jgi:hypothetical protein
LQESGAQSLEAAERRDLWNESKTSETPMPEGMVLSLSSTEFSGFHLLGNADAIRQAMSGFSLPSSNIPSWANTLDEKEWKAQLLKRLQKKNSDGSK